MSERIEKLVSEISEAAKGRLPSTDVQRLTDEVRAHLDSSIQARIEKGDSIEAATDHAIKEFGSVQDFLKPVLDRAPKTTNKNLFWIAWISILALMCIVCLAGRSTAIPASILLCVVGVISVASVGLTGWRTGRWSIKPLTLAYLAALPFACLILSSDTVVTRYPNYTNRGSLEVDIASAGPVIANINKERGAFNDLRQTALAGIASSKGPYKVPARMLSGQYRYQLESSKSGALALLNHETHKNYRFWDDAIYTEQQFRDANLAALGHPARNYFQLLIPTALFSGTWALILMIANAVGALAKIVSRLRIKSLRRGLA